MTVPSVDSLVENASLLVDHFGNWPSFHDAEILDLHLWRGKIKPGDWDDSNVFPVLTMKILILRATQTPYAGGRSNVVAALRFHDVSAIRMDDFNHVNQIVDLTITIEERGTLTTGERLPPYLRVSITRGFGMEAVFRCFRIEVLDATPVLPTEEP